MKVILSIVAALCVSAHAQYLSNNIIATSRGQDWTIAGLPSQALPDASWTQCGSTIAFYTGTAATINNALNSCSSNQYVLLGSGNFSLSTGIIFPANITGHLALRGSGANSTFLSFTGTGVNCGGFGTAWICLASSDGTYAGNGANTVYNWTAGYSQGTTQLTLSSVTNIVANQTLLILNQCDTGFSGSNCSTGSATDNGNYFVCAAQWNGTTGCSFNGPDGTSWRSNAWQVEIVLVTAINQGGCGATCVTINQPLKHPNWASGQSPQAVIMQPLPQDGIENLAMDGSASTSANIGIFFYNAYQGFVSGVKMTNIGPGSGSTASAWFINNVDVSHMQFQQNYLYHALCATGCDPYGIRVQTGGDNLFLANIIQQVRIATSTDGSSAGDVFAYNHSIYQQYASDFMFGAFWNHSAGDDFQLWEGNTGDQIQNDYLHGSHLDETKFRNFLWGWESCATNPTQQCGGVTFPKDSGTQSVYNAAYTRYNNDIGNVLGQPSYHNAYQTTNTPPSNTAIWAQGSGDGASCGVSPCPPTDTVTATTSMRWGNYDTVTGAIRWCGNPSDTGWSTTCSSTSEVPTGISPYPNSVPILGDTGAGQNTMPPSFLYAFKPAWFGVHAWPAIGPDVSSGNVGICSGSLNVSGKFNGLPASSNSNCGGNGFTASSWGGHVNLTPAMDCFLNTMGGVPDGTGSALVFNPSLCYPTQAVVPGAAFGNNIGIGPSVKWH
jgi:hypothetical protein